MKITVTVSKVYNFESSLIVAGYITILMINNEILLAWQIILL